MVDNNISMGLVHVTCPNHHEILITRFWEFLKKNHNADLVFKLGGKSLHAHKLIVEVFLSPDKLVDSSLNPHNFDILLEFMYKGTVAVDDQELDHLLVIAQQLHFDLLIEAVQLASKQLRITGSQQHVANLKVSRNECLSESTNDSEHDHNIHSDADQVISSDDAKQEQVDSERESDDSLYIPGSYKQSCLPAKQAVGRRVRLAKSIAQTKITNASIRATATTNSKGEMHHKPKMFDCKMCNFSYQTEKARRHHQCSKVAGTLRQFACHHCDFTSPRLTYFTTHLATHDNVCQMTATNLKALDSHLTTHSTLSCPHCDYTATKATNYQQHLKLEHNLCADGNTKKQLDKNVHRLVYKCKTCNHAYQTREVLAGHACKGKWSPVKMFECHHCGHTTQRIARFRAHLSCHDSSISVLKCPICKCPVVSLKALQRHTETQHPNFACPHCPYHTVKSKNYRQHLHNRHWVNCKGEPVGGKEANNVEFQSEDPDESGGRNGCNSNRYLSNPVSFTSTSSTRSALKSKSSDNGGNSFDNGHMTDPTVEMALTLDIYRTDETDSDNDNEDNQTCSDASNKDDNQQESSMPTTSGIAQHNDYTLKSDGSKTVISAAQNILSQKLEQVITPKRRGRPPKQEFHTCKQCNHAFHTETACYNHQCSSKFSTYKVFECHHCRYETFRVAMFRVHLATHDSTMLVLRCPTCEQAVPDQRALEKHLEIHLEKQCPHCSFKTNIAKSLVLHLSRQHQEDATVDSVSGKSGGHHSRGKSNEITSKRNDNEVESFVHDDQSDDDDNESDGSLYTPHSTRQRSTTTNKASYLSTAKQKRDSSTIQKPIVKRLKVFRCKLCNFAYQTDEARAAHSCSKIPSRYKKFQCHHCDWTSFRTSFFIAHLSTHDSSISVLRCQTCNMPMLDESALERHMVRVHQKEFLCPHCGFTTTDDKLFRGHLRSVHKVTPKGQPLRLKYNCNHCGWSTCAAADYEIHMAKHENPNIVLLRCKDCYRAFVSEESKSSHTCSKKRFRKKYKCKQCPYMTQREALYKLHMVRRHGAKEKIFRCRYCPEPFASAKALKRHKQTQHLLYACSLCQFETNSTDDYHHHVKLFHRDAAAEPAPPNANRRTYEAATTTTTSNNDDENDDDDDQVDEQGHSLGTPKNDLTASIVGCGACNHAFLSEESLENHECTKIKARHCIFVCPLCEYVTEVKARYMIHFAKHDNSVASYRCDICKVPYASAECLERHKQTHRKYTCRHCPFETPRYNEIYVHRKTHADLEGPTTTNKKRKRKWTDSD